MASPLYVNVRHDIVADNARTGRRNSVFEIRRSIDDANPERCNYRSFEGRIRLRMPWEEAPLSAEGVQNGRAGLPWSLEVIPIHKTRTWWLSDDLEFQYTGVSHLIYRPEAAPDRPVWIEIEWRGNRLAWMEISAAAARSPATAPLS